MSENTLVGLATGLLFVLVVVLFRARRLESREQDRRELVSQLVPEIRAILESSEASAFDTTRYAAIRSRVTGLLPRETAYTVDTFYQCAAALVEASNAMREAFDEDREVSLGDRIRAKDRRDRCMKDVYYAGEAAIQKLES